MTNKIPEKKDQLKPKILTWIKNEWRKYDIVYALLILLIAFAVYLFFGSAFYYSDRYPVAHDLLAGAFAAIFTSLVVIFVIGVQTRQEHSKKVFQEKIQLYKSITSHLEEIQLELEDNELESEPKSKLENKSRNKLEFDLIRLYQLANKETIESFNKIIDFINKQSDNKGGISFTDEIEGYLLEQARTFANNCRVDLEVGKLPIDEKTTNETDKILKVSAQKKQRDYTKYNLTLKKINGEIETPKLKGKGRTVLAIMKYLISEGIVSDKKEIEEIGNKKYGNNLRLLERFELPSNVPDASSYVESELSKKGIDQTRYFTDPEDIIKRSDLKMVFVVSNQWGSGNLPEFLSDIVKKYGDYVRYSEVKE